MKKYVTAHCIMLWVGANINCHRYNHGGQAAATWASEGYTKTARVTPNKLSVGGACISSLEVAAGFTKNHQDCWLREVKHPVVFSGSAMECTLCYLSQ